MVLTGVHLFFIMLGFIVFVGGLLIFFYRHKFQIAKRLASQLGFTAYLSEKNVPAEITKLGESILEFRFFEWVLVGEHQGKKVFLAQYFINRASQYPFRFVAFTLFDQKHDLKVQQDGDFLITGNGIFYYRGTPFAWQKENVLPILEKLVEVRTSFEK